jgi:Spy/CpxP family protein refolding chaperone
MEANMKKYKMIMFSVLMSMLLVLPVTLLAERGMRYRDMKGEGIPIDRWHHHCFSSLDIDEDVLREMREMRLKNKENMLELKNQIEKKKLEMEKALLEEELDFKKILSIHDDISELRQKISRKMIEQKIEMYKLLPDDKKEEARKMFLRQFLGKGHRKPGMYGEEGKFRYPMGK